MQNSSSYYSVPKYHGGVWADWSASRAGESSSWASSSTMTTKEAPFTVTSTDSPPRSAIPITYTLTPPTPDATDSDVSSSSQLSMESIPEFDEMPEIPFVSASVTYPDEWAPSSDRPAEQSRIGDSCETSSFWSSIIGLRASASKSSDASSSPMLGHTTLRNLAPSRTSRKRAGSVSSIASSRTKPAPAKSILSSSDSVRTRRRKAPSVKFLDIPTVHYDDEYPLHDEHASPSPSSTSMAPPPKKKAKGLGGLFSLRWLFGPSSKTGNRAAAPARPAISGPYPLWDAPPRRAYDGGAGAGGGSARAASLRSVKSSASLRSVRSCGSRLPTPTYWPR
ncbi:hypothetical protein BD413DRAFT_249507 [Trametes elegans]|nr:hypothetical protein BD413DRAFT_249507 [Trametes elegans]